MLCNRVFVHKRRELVLMKNGDVVYGKEGSGEAEEVLRREDIRGCQLKKEYIFTIMMKERDLAFYTFDVEATSWVEKIKACIC